MNRFDASLQPPVVAQGGPIQPVPPVPRVNRFDQSAVGIVVNTVKELPRAAKKVGGGILHFLKEVGQSILRSATSAGLSIGTDVGQLMGKFGAPDYFSNVQVPPGLEKIYGAKEIKNLQTRIAEGELKIQQSPFAQKHGLDKYAFPLSFAGVIGGTTLDVSLFGGEEAVTKKLAKETSPEIITKILTKLGIVDDVAKKLAPEIAQTTDRKVIKDILENASHLSNTAKVSETFGAHAADTALEQEAKKFATVDDFIASQRALGGEVVKTDAELKALYNQATGAGIRDALVGAEEKATGEIPQVVRRGTGEAPSTPLGSFLSKGENAADSLKTSIADVTPTVKEKVHVLDYMQTPEFVLKKIGLENEAAALRVAHEKYLAELPQEIQKIVTWQDVVKNIPDASKKIFRHLDTGEALDNPKLIAVADEIKMYFKQWADRLGLPEDNRIASYVTHIFERDFINKEFDPDIAKMITNRVAGSVYDPFLEKRLGKLGYREDVFAALDAYVKRAVRKVNMDPALMRLSAASNRLDVESYNYVAKLVARVNLRPTELDNLVDNLVKSIVGYKFGPRPVTYLTSKIRQIFYRGALGLNLGSAVRNLTQGANTFAQLGTKYTLLGYTKLFSRLMTNNLEELTAEGVLRDALVEDRRIGVYKTFLQKLDTPLFKMFDLAEKINRGAAYYGAKARALAKGETPEKASEIGKALVRKTQFAFGSIDSPVALSSDITKTLFQLQSYNVKQIEFLKDMVKKKEFAGIIRYTVASFAMIYTIGRAFGMQPKDIIPTFRLGGSPLGNAFTSLLGLTSSNEQTKASAKGKLESTAATLVPGGAQIRKSILGAKAYNQGKDTTPTGRTRFKIEKNVPNFLQSLLFGKSSLPAAQEYYKNIGKPKAKTSPVKNRFNP